MKDLVFNYDIENLGSVTNYGTYVSYVKIKKTRRTKHKFDPVPIIGEMMLSEFQLVNLLTKIVKDIQPNDANELIELIAKYGEDSYQSGADNAILFENDSL